MVPSLYDFDVCAECRMCSVALFLKIYSRWSYIFTVVSEAHLWSGTLYIVFDIFLIALSSQTNPSAYFAPHIFYVLFVNEFYN